jgi:hypothetical protein
MKSRSSCSASAPIPFVRDCHWMVKMKLIGVEVKGGTTNKFIGFFLFCIRIGICPFAQLRHSRLLVVGVLVRFTLDFVEA